MAIAPNAGLASRHVSALNGSGSSDVMFAGTGPPLTVAVPPHWLQLRGVVQQMEVFGAGPEIVMPLRVVRIREVVVNRVGVLVAIPWDIAVAIAAEPAEREVRSTVGDAVASLPVLRPVT